MGLLLLNMVELCNIMLKEGTECYKREIMKLNELKVAKSAVITKVSGQGALRQHFLDMGVIPGVSVTVVKLAPMGDPMELRIHGYELTLRLADAEKILIDESSVTKADGKREKNTKNISKENAVTEHPGLGEGGKYHAHEDRQG